MHSLRPFALLMLAGAFCVLCSPAAEPPAKPTKEQIAQWIRQLGDDDFSTRETASRKLNDAGQAAEISLQEATRSEDAEVVRRATEILDRFKWGLYPDTPKKVVDLVSRYRTADLKGKNEVIKELLESGPEGYRTLLKIAGAEEDPMIRSGVFRLISEDVARQAPKLIADENYDTLDLLMDVLLAGDAEQGVSYYAAYWMMRGKLDDRIAHAKAMAGKGPDAKRSWEVLANLYHAKGDLVAAREAADKADKPELADALLFEAGDWKTLAARPIHTQSNTPYESLGFQAAYHRLSGDAKGFDQALADLRKSVDAVPGDEYERFYLAKVMFLNDRPAEGIEMLVNTPGRQAAAFEALAAQMNYKAALALVEKAKAANSPEFPVLEILKARTLYSLGDKEKATAVFARYGDEIKAGADFAWFETLIDSENKIGLKDQAVLHTARVLAASQDMGWPRRLFPKLFSKNAEAAEVLWMVLRPPQPDQTAAAAALTKVRGLLAGKAGQTDLGDLVKAAEDGINALQADEADKRRLALAEAALAMKQEAEGRAFLEKAGSTEAFVRLGDLHAEKKEWDKAAEQYAKAWEKDHTLPLALFLNGYALVQAGQEKEGKKRMELAHWMPLGDGDARFAFLRSLSERGQREAVRREGELLLRLSVAGSYHAMEGMRQEALDALDRKDYAGAADGQERSMLRCLSNGVNYVQPAAYLGVPTFVHRLRAQAYTAAGKFDEARRETALGLAALPGDTFFPIELVPAWEKAGHKKEADELFKQCLAVQEKLAEEYPNCTWGHNSAAWVSACCRRNLESAQEHALKAVALVPGNAGNLDTLAEVYFQRGDKDKAIATQKKAIELDPKKAYFRKQLKRIEAGDPAAERPSEEGDEE